LPGTRRPRRSRCEWLLLAALCLCAPARARSESLTAGEFTPPRPAPEIALAGSNGSELRLSQYRGKVVVLAFGFTSCPEVCPTTLATLADARKQLGERAKDLQVVYVTVDPERDTAARMKEYLAGFDATFVGGTGSESQLAAVRKDFGVEAHKTATGSYGHSSFTYLIDRAGSLRALMPYGHPAADYAHDVKLLLAE
jgi:protein SCO1/2